MFKTPSGRLTCEEEVATGMDTMNKDWLVSQQWTSGDVAQSVVGMSPYTMRKHANNGELTYGIHYIRLGEHNNSRYMWNPAECLKHYASRKLGTPADKKPKKSDQNPKTTGTLEAE